MSEEMKTQETVDTETTAEQTQETSQKAPSKKEILREMSKEYGVNLFDAERLQAFKEFQESQKTELEKLQEQVNSFNNEKTAWESKQTDYEAKLASLKLGVNEESLDDAITLAKTYLSEDVNMEQALSKVLEKYPSFGENKQSTKKIKIGTQVKDNQEKPENMDEVAKYMEQHYKNNPYYTKK